jgi:hypothetical protein
MSIVKGEYSEPFVEEEGDDKDLEKDMSAANTDMLTSHEPAHSNSPAKPGNVKNLVSLTKSQVYEAIIKKYYTENLDITKNIYNFVKSVNDKCMENKETVTQDTLSKAFSILDNLVKGEATEVVEASTETPADAEKPVVEEIVKSEELEFAKSLHAEGLTKEACVEGMIRKGYGYTSSLEAIEKVIAEAPAKDVETTLLKSEDVAKLVLADVTKSLNDTISKSLDPITDIMKSGFGAVNDLLKAQENENTLLKSQIDTLVTRLERVENTPVGTRSVRNVAQLDKFAKSEDAGALQEGFRTVSISDDIAKSQIMGEFETNFDLAKSQDEKQLWGGAMSRMETCGLAHVDPKILNHLKIKLTN